MAVTILEALQNAEINLETVKNIGMGTAILPIAQQQLHNAITLLEKGYGINDYVEDLIGSFDRVENVPEAPNHTP